MLRDLGVSRGDGGFHLRKLLLGGGKLRLQNGEFLAGVSEFLALSLEFGTACLDLLQPLRFGGEVLRTCNVFILSVSQGLLRALSHGQGLCGGSGGLLVRLLKCGEA